MFTGIVQEQCEIRERIPGGEGIRFSLTAPLLSGKFKTGDSVACDGVCLTVEQCAAPHFWVYAVPETLARTTLGEWKPGDPVNLEAALTPQTPLGGHFVMGHIDGTCGVVAIQAPSNGEGRELTVRLPEEFLPYCVYKGSLALSGVSLTIASIEGDHLRFALIPHTLKSTHLGKARTGTRLNFEVDILSKYVQRQLTLAGARHAAPLQGSGIRETDLEGWGYGIP